MITSLINIIVQQLWRWHFHFRTLYAVFALSFYILLRPCASLMKNKHHIFTRYLDYYCARMGHIIGDPITIICSNMHHSRLHYRQEISMQQWTPWGGTRCGHLLCLSTSMSSKAAIPTVGSTALMPSFEQIISRRPQQSSQILSLLLGPFFTWENNS